MLQVLGDVSKVSPCRQPCQDLWCMLCPRPLRTCNVAFESKGILGSFDIDAIEGLVISRVIIKSLGIDGAPSSSS